MRPRVYGLAKSSEGLAFPRPGREPLAERIDRTELAERSRAVPVAEGHGDAIEVVACGSPLPGASVPRGRRSRPRSARTPPEAAAIHRPSSTAGYHDNAEATHALFDGDRLETGDLAYFAGGEVYPTGRITDVVIGGGRNIHPHELEAAIGERVLAGLKHRLMAPEAAAEAIRAHAEESAITSATSGSAGWSSSC
ncbi:MAG: hypothetical protein OXI22_10100 [Defluviicoccus sp.]|nr:hypothetical protein [Defluviicoccus sp.]MDE0384226.1 hypothetical protein [Defluviicoccus sp.]